MFVRNRVRFECSRPPLHGAAVNTGNEVPGAGPATSSPVEVTKRFREIRASQLFFSAGIVLERMISLLA